jgi:hypothetical protein
MPRTPTSPPSLTTNHALYTGWVLGLMAKAGLPITPMVDDDGNYTNRVTLTLESGPITLMIPAPPDTWRFDPLA